ncbi:MAG: AAA family ATPase [Burkholderiaceae bacterium]|nr:AAA family ATPase [Burkholderiaceae bacterium]
MESLMTDTKERLHRGRDGDRAPVPPFLTRVVLRNYKSVAGCDVRLGALTYLVGPNGSGKSNFLDALHLVRDALSGSLDNALNERGGLQEVRRKSSGHPTHFGIRLEFVLRDGRGGHYAFNVGALNRGGYDLQQAFGRSRSFRKLCSEWERQSKPPR